MIHAGHAEGRARAHTLTVEGMLNIANNSGNRCYKRSVYSMLEPATYSEFFEQEMDDPLWGKG